MDEMAKTLARRRAQAESANQSNDNENGRFNGANSTIKDKSALVNGCSPSKDDSNSHRRNGPSEETTKLNGLSDNDMDRLKQEIMTDIRKELQKLKLDIVEALKVELNRR